MTHALRMDGVGFGVGKHTILSDLSFDLPAAQVTGIAGINGAGKTTLLKLACGEQHPSTGTIFLGGEPLGRLPRRQRAQRIAILPQASSLQFDFSVREVVALGLAPHDLSTADAEAAVRWSMASCDIAGLAERSYLSLSGGEQQRVHLARVLAQLSPGGADGDLGGQVLLLDEPMSAMDLPNQEHCLHLVRELAARRCAVLIVLHDINMLARISDRMLLLRDGRLQAQGPVRELLTDEILSRLYDHPIEVLANPGGALPLVRARPPGT